MVLFRFPLAFVEASATFLGVHKKYMPVTLIDKDSHTRNTTQCCYLTMSNPAPKGHFTVCLSVWSSMRSWLCIILSVAVISYSTWGL